VIAEGIPSSTQCNSRYDRIRQKERAAVGSGSPVSACQPRFRDGRVVGWHPSGKFQVARLFLPFQKILRRGSQNVTSQKNLRRESQNAPSIARVAAGAFGFLTLIGPQSCWPRRSRKSLCLNPDAGHFFAMLDHISTVVASRCFCCQPKVNPCHSFKVGLGGHLSRNLCFSLQFGSLS